MNKRLFFGLLAAFVAGKATSASAKASGSATFVVPHGVKKIRVRSYAKGEKVLDRSLSVTPGQTFVIDPV